MYRGRGVADYELLRGQAALFPESEVRILFPAAHRPTAVPGHCTARAEARVAGLNPARLISRRSDFDYLRRAAVPANRFVGAPLVGACHEQGDHDCCDAPLFAFGFADEPFESGHVGDPEVATLTV